MWARTLSPGPCWAHASALAGRVPRCWGKWERSSWKGSRCSRRTLQGSRASEGHAGDQRPRDHLVQARPPPGGSRSPHPAPPHSQAQEHTQTCVHTHTHARHAPGNACRRLRRNWLEGKRCARQRPLPLLDPGVSQGLGLEVKRDRDGAGETSCSPGLSWREGPGGIRGNCPAGLPAPLPSRGGASGPPVRVCGGGAGPPSWAGGREGALLRTGLPRPLRELSGEEAPASGRASRLALGAALGAPLFPRASSPHAPFRTQLGAREDPAHPGVYAALRGA